MYGLIGLFLFVAVTRLVVVHRYNGCNLADFNLEATRPIRGLLAIFVVLGHCDNELPCCSLLKWFHLATPAVALFFFMSGYGLVRSFLKSSNSTIPYLQGFLARSFIKLFVPFFIALFLWVALNIVMGENFLPRGVRLSQQFVAFVKSGISIPPASWYVFTLFIFYFCFSVSFHLKNKKLALVLLTTLIIIYYLVFKYVLGWRFNWWKTCLSFAIGGWYAYYEGNIREWIRMFRFWPYAGLILITAGIYSLGHFRESDNSILFNIRYLVMGPALAMSCYLLPLPPKKCLKTILAIFSFVGGISFELYLCHCIPQYGIVSLFRNGTLYFMVVLSLTVILAIAMHRVDTCIIKIFYRKFRLVR